MKFDLVNDIHTDLWTRGPASINWKAARNPGSDVLVIAGDTSNYIDELTVVLQQASEVYEHVMFTDGNHEHYFWGNDVDDLEQYLRELVISMPNVTYLYGTNSVRLGNTVFIGCNGWYDFRVSEPRWSVIDAMQAWQRGSNDPRMIDFGKMPVAVRALFHSAHMTKQVEELQDEDVDIVAFTHTAPHRAITQWSAYTNTPNAIMDGAYYNTSMEDAYFADVNKRIKVWAYGHTHQRLDNKIGHIRYVNNARGYECERGEIGQWFVAQIDTEDKGYES